jgi:hypothetical protein
LIRSCRRPDKWEKDEPGYFSRAFFLDPEEKSKFKGGAL